MYVGINEKYVIISMYYTMTFLFSDENSSLFAYKIDFGNSIEPP